MQNSRYRDIARFINQRHRKLEWAKSGNQHKDLSAMVDSWDGEITMCPPGPCDHNPFQRYPEGKDFRYYRELENHDNQ